MMVFNVNDDGEHRLTIISDGKVVLAQHGQRTLFPGSKTFRAAQCIGDATNVLRTGDGKPRVGATKGTWLMVDAWLH